VGAARDVRFLLALVILVLALLPGCQVQRALTRSLPGQAGAVSVSTTVTQPFYSPGDGLDGLSIGIGRDEATTI
jgi:hypothetical protein